MLRASKCSYLSSRGLRIHGIIGGFRDGSVWYRSHSTRTDQQVKDELSYRIDIKQRHNTKFVTERLEKKITRHRPDVSPDVARLSRALNEDSRTCSHSFMKELQSEIVTAVMSQSVNENNILQMRCLLRDNDIKLSLSQIFEALGFLRDLEYLKVPTNLQSTDVVHSLASSSLCSFISAKILDFQDINQEKWSSSHTAKAMSKLNHLNEKNEGSSKLLTTLYKMEVNRKENVSIQDVSRMASGLRCARELDDITVAWLGLLASRIGGAALPTSNTVVKPTEIQSLFHVLQTLNSSDLRRPEPVNNYLASLSKFLSNVDPTAFTMNDIYEKVLPYLKHLTCNNKLEYSLLQSVATLLLESDQSFSPRLGLCCQSLEGVQNMSSRHKPVEVILKNICESIERSCGLLSSSMMCSVLRGLRHKPVIDEPVLKLLTALNTKTSVQYCVSSLESVRSEQKNKKTDRFCEYLIAFADVLPSLGSSSPVVKEFLDLQAEFLQLSMEQLRHPCITKKIYESYAINMPAFEKSTEMLLLTCRVIGNCHHLTSSRNIIMKNLYKCMKTIRVDLANQSYLAKELPTKALSIHPKFVVNAFNGLSNSMGSDPEAVKLLQILTEVLEECTKQGSRHELSNSDIYQIMWSTRNLYPRNMYSSQEMKMLTKILSRCISSRSSAENKAIASTDAVKVFRAVHSFRSLMPNPRDECARDLLALVISDLESIATQGAYRFEGKDAVVNVQDMLYGIRAMSSSRPEVTRLLSCLTKILNRMQSPFNAQHARSWLRSLQHLNSDDPEVCNFVKALSVKLAQSTGELPYTQFLRSLDSFQGLSSSEPEVRSLISALVSKTSPPRKGSYDSHTSWKQHRMSLMGFQRMKSDYIEVRNLIKMFSFAFSSKLSEPISAKELNSFLGCFHGMRGFNSDHVEVRDFVRNMSNSLQAVRKSVSFADDKQRYPFVGFISTAIYGLQNMKSCHPEVLSLISQVSELLKRCAVSSNARKLSTREMLMALTGMRNFDSHEREVRLLLRRLLPHVRMCGASESLDRQLSRVLESLIGFQNMHSEHEEVLQMVQAMTSKVKQSGGDITTTSIAKCLLGCQHLREHSPDASEFDSSPRGSKHVNKLLFEITDKIWRQFEPDQRPTSHGWVVNGDFVSAAFIGLKNRSSGVPEVRHLMVLLNSILRECPVGTDMHTHASSSIDSRLKPCGLTSFQLSTCLAAMNACSLQHSETVELLKSLLPHLQHLRDRNVQKAVDSIKIHFSNERFSNTSTGVDVHSSVDVFGGRHLSNILYGIGNMEASHTSAEIRKILELVEDMVQANCNTTLTERVNNGITISVRDCNSSTWSSQDVCIAMGALRHCKRIFSERMEERDLEPFFVQMIDEMHVSEGGEESSHAVAYGDSSDQEGFESELFLYDTLAILAESLENLRLDTRRNNSDGSDLSDTWHELMTPGTGDDKVPNELPMRRVVSVPHLACAASGLRYLDGGREVVQRSLHAIADRLQDNYLFSFFPEDNDSVLSLQAESDYSKVYEKCLLSPQHPQFKKPSCKPHDLRYLLRAVCWMSARYNAVGRIYEEASRLIYDHKVSEALQRRGMNYVPPIGHLSFNDISEIFYELRFNQCASEVRLVVSSLNAQLAGYRKGASKKDIDGRKLAMLLNGMASMSTSSLEVTEFLLELHRCLRHKRASVSQLSSAEVGTILRSMAHMSISEPSVLRLLSCLGDLIEHSPHMSFSTEEMYMALEGLSRMSATHDACPSDVMSTVNRLIDLIRQRCL